MAKLLFNLTGSVTGNLTNIITSIPSILPNNSPNIPLSNLPSLIPSSLPNLSSLSNLSISNLTDIMTSIPSILSNNLTGIIPHINISNIDVNIPIEVKGNVNDDNFKLNMMISNDLMLFIAFIGLVVGCVSLCYTCIKKTEYNPQFTINSPPPERELMEMLNKNSKNDKSELIANPYHPDDSVV